MFSSPDPKKTFLDLGDGPSGDENNGFFRHLKKKIGDETPFRHLKKNAGDEKKRKKNPTLRAKKGFWGSGNRYFRHLTSRNGLGVRKNSSPTVGDETVTFFLRHLH